MTTGLKVTNYGLDHPFAVVRGRVAGSAAVGTATLQTLGLIVITPATLTANTDNWNPTGLSTASVIRASTNATWNLTGIVAPADDRLLILANIGTQDLVLIHNATSTAANRFLGPDDADVTLGPDTWTWLLYDLTSARWRVLGAGAGSIPAGTYELAIEGGQSVISAHGSMGATETFDPTAGNVHTGTLNAACTFTISAPVGSGAATLEFWITQDGTGGWAITWPGSVTWDGGTPTPDTAAGVTVRYILESVDGGTTWIGNLVGGGLSAADFATPAIVLGTAAAAGVATTVIRSDGTIVAFDVTVPTTIAYSDAAATGSVAFAARRDHRHGMAAAGIGEILISDTPSTPLIFADLIQNEAQDDLVYADP
jgi:hypothetical protein